MARSSMVTGRRKTATIDMSFKDKRLQACEQAAELVKDMSSFGLDAERE